MLLRNIGLPKLKKMTRAFIKDESGQSTTEYVLLLFMVVVAVRAAGGQLKGRLTKILDAAFSQAETEIGRGGE